MSATATISFRVKPDIKRRADALFARLGMSTSAAMNILLIQSLAHRGFPCPITLPDEADETPNETTRQAIEDLDNDRNLSRYDSVDALLEDAL